MDYLRIGNVCGEFECGLVGKMECMCGGAVWFVGIRDCMWGGAVWIICEYRMYVGRGSLDWLVFGLHVRWGSAVWLGIGTVCGEV